MGKGLLDDLRRNRKFGKCLDLNFDEKRAKFEGGQRPALEGFSPPSNVTEAGAAFAFVQQLTESSRLLTSPGQPSLVRKPAIGSEARNCTHRSGVDQPGCPGQGTRLGQQKVTTSYSRGLGPVSAKHPND